MSVGESDRPPADLHLLLTRAFREDEVRNERVEFSVQQNTSRLMNGGHHTIVAPVEGVRRGWTEHVVQVHLYKLKQK